MIMRSWPKWTDRVVVMYRGEKVEKATARGDFENPKMDDTKALTGRGPEAGRALPAKASPSRLRVIGQPGPCANSRPTHEPGEKRILEVKHLITQLSGARRLFSAASWPMSKRRRRPAFSNPRGENPQPCGREPGLR